MDIREEFYTELKQKIEDAGIKGIKYSNPSNGATIKINGIVLFKISQSNPYRKRGVVIWKHLTDSAIADLGGKRSGDKKNWTACPLTRENYHLLLGMLFDICTKINIKTKGGSRKVRVRRTPMSNFIDSISFNVIDDLSPAIEVPVVIKPKKKIRSK